MTGKRSARLNWVGMGPAEGQDDDLGLAPGQLEHHQDFLRIARLGFCPRRDRWKWSGFRLGRAPHGFEGVCASRAAALRAAERAYFAD